MNTALANPKLYELLRSHGVVEAAVFGSYARNTDILEEVLGKRVDLVSKRGLSKRLESRIKKDLKLI